MVAIKILSADGGVGVGGEGTWQNRADALWPCDSRLIKLVLLWPFARLGSVTWPAALNWEQLQIALFILYLKLEHGVGVVHGQEPLQSHRGLRLDIVADILGHALKWPDQQQHEVFERKQSLTTHLM